MATSNAVNTLLALSDIYVDYTWNSRSNLPAQIEQYRNERDKSGRKAALSAVDGTPDEMSEGKSKGFKGIMASVRLHGVDAGKEIHDGQMTPVVVRLRRKDEKFKQPYVLVAGFTRLAVIAEIAAEEGEKKPVIKAFPPRPMSEEEALEVNGIENLVRDDLSTPDKCMIIVRMKRENPSLTQTSIALALGLHQTYVGKCLSIATNVKGTVQTGKGTYEPILDHWRRSPVQIPVDKMLRVAAALTKDKQPDAEKQSELYAELLRDKQTTGKGGKRSHKAKVEDAIKRAQHFASMVGTLEHKKVLQVDDPDALFSDHLHMFVSIPKDATDGEKNKIASAADTAYQLGLEGKAEKKEDDKKVPEDRPSKAGKKGTAKKGNASASAN